jgi:hypothetical protein
MSEVIGESIQSVLLDNKKRRSYSLLFTRYITHYICSLEGIIYGTAKGNINPILSGMFHNLLGLSILSGFDPEDIGFDTMFLLNAKALINNNIILSSLITCFFHTNMWLEDALGWGLKKEEIDWQEVRNRLRDVFSAFSALCLKCGLDFDMVCYEYAESKS